MAHRPLASSLRAERSVPVPSLSAALRWLIIAAAAGAPVILLAQPAGAGGDGFTFRRPALSITVRGGYDRPMGRSDIYDFATKQLTLNKRDFAAASYQVDLNVRVSERFDLGISGGEATRTSPSEFRNFIDNNDQPIEQNTRLRRVPLTLGVKYALTAPGERIGKFAWIPARLTPWAGLGGGTMRYNFTQVGDFVDFQTLNVFTKEYTSEGWTPMAYVHLGADLMLNTHFALTGDLRYTTARAPLSGAFVGFNKIDLSGTAASMGLTLRY